MVSWFRASNSHVRSAQSRNAKASRRSPVQLRLEALEDRWVPSPITHVRDLGVASSNASAATLSITAPAAGVAAGDTIFVEIGGSTSSATVSVADTKGNTYQQDLGNFLANNPTALFSARATTALAAGDNITVTFTGSAPLLSVASASEFSGIAATGRLDQTQTNTGNNNSPNSGQTATTTQAKELLFGAVATGAGSNTTTPPTIAFTPGASYAALTGAQTSVTLLGPSGNTLQLEPEFQLVAATGKYQADGALSVTGSAFVNWAAGIATYKAADATTQFSVTASNPNPDGGTPFSITVTAQDPSKATATGYTGTVHFTSSDPQATLPADFTFTAADMGTHTFTGVILKSGGSQTVTATDTNSAAGFTAGTTVNVKTVATHLGLTTATATPTVGAPFTVIVTALDANNVKVPTYTGTVHFTSSDKQAVLPADFAFTAADNGAHTFSVTLKTPGAQTVTATDTTTASVTGVVNATALTANQQFVERVFADLLGRQADNSGLAFYSNQLDAGTGRAQAVAQIEQSPEYLARQVNKAFVLLLKRGVDPDGKSFFVNFLQNGGTDEQMLALIASSPEYFTSRAKSDNNTYIQTIFQDLLNRPLDATGQTFFSQQLANGATRNQIATQILTSLEYRKDFVAADYQAFLRRGPDFGATDWVIMLLQGSTDEQITAGILSSSEYFARS